jgi:hypothetical protein
MTRFAKLAAETVYDSDLDEAPPEKVPSWKRALPWVIGGLGAAGLGYAAYKGLSPAPEGPSLITQALAGPFAAANQATGGALPGGALAGVFHGAHSAIKDRSLHAADKNLTFAQAHERGLNPEVTPDSIIKGPWAYGKPAYNQAELSKLVQNDADKLITPTAKVPELKPDTKELDYTNLDSAGIPTEKVVPGKPTGKFVDPQFTIPQGGTNSPLEALKAAYGEKAGFGDILKDLNDPNYATKTPELIAKAETLMGGRKIDPKEAASYLKRLELNSKAFHTAPGKQITENALRRGTATGILTALLLGVGNIALQGGK